MSPRTTIYECTSPGPDQVLTETNGKNGLGPRRRTTNLTIRWTQPQEFPVTEFKHRHNITSCQKSK